MKFTMEDDTFGFCDCDLSKRCGRPLVFWPARNRCYEVYSQVSLRLIHGLNIVGLNLMTIQGPCRDGKWLVFGFNLEPVCKKNICANQEEGQPSFGSRYWFNVNTTCYRTSTQGYCPRKEDVLFNMDTHYRPTCQPRTDCGDLNPVQVAMCLPGQRMDVLGNCKRRFIPLRNTTKPLRIYVTQKPTNIYCLFCDENSKS